MIHHSPEVRIVYTQVIKKPLIMPRRKLPIESTHERYTLIACDMVTPYVGLGVTRGTTHPKLDPL
jgi:hypothetical protein